MSQIERGAWRRPTSFLSTQGNRSPSAPAISRRRIHALRAAQVACRAGMSRVYSQLDITRTLNKAVDPRIRKCCCGFSTIAFGCGTICRVLYEILYCIRSW